MLRQIFLLLPILLLSAQLHAKDPITAKVKRVIDGDTIELTTGEKVRLIGVDTPEFKDKKRNAGIAKSFRIDPHHYQAYAEKATDWAREFLDYSNQVTLVYDELNAKTDHKDKYGRTLAYVFLYLPENMLIQAKKDMVWDGEKEQYFLNASIIKGGYGLVYRRFKFKYKSKFLKFEFEARGAGRGMWAKRIIYQPPVIDESLYKHLKPMCSTGGALRIYGISSIYREGKDEIFKKCDCIGKEVNVPSEARDGGWVGCDGEIRNLCYTLSRSLTGNEPNEFMHERKLPSDAIKVPCPD